MGGDVAEEALARIGDERVRGLLAGLSFDQRSVLLMRVVGDLTVEQVARALSFFGMFATFDTPFDVTTSELAIEFVFPADPPTATALEDLHRK